MNANISDQLLLCYMQEEAISAQAIAEAANERIPRLLIKHLKISNDLGVTAGDYKTFEQSRFVAIFLSRKFNTLYEKLNLLRKENLTLRTFVIRLDDCNIPQNINHLQWVDLFEDSGLEHFMQSIYKEFYTFVDPRDGQKYRTLEIGSRMWLAENLSYEVADSYWYDDEPRNGAVFGRLYPWKTLKAACPEGWHIPYFSDWYELGKAIGVDWTGIQANPQIDSSSDAFEKLIDGGESGFDALLAGTRDARFGQYYEKFKNGYYWGQSNDGNEPHLWAISTNFGRKVVRFRVDNDTDLENAYSFRCVKNETQEK